jgi:inosose dehydratase
VWFPNDPAQVPWTRFLDEIAQAGYEWLELGPYGYLPTDPSQLADEVGRRGLRVSGGTVGGALQRADAWPSALDAAQRVAKLASALGAQYMVYLPDGDGELDQTEWSRLVKGVDELGKIVKQEHGVQLVFHPHADSYVETQPQVERFLADTNPDYVSLCQDTGHIAYGRGDNCALIDMYPSRIGYVHLKQVDPKVLDAVDAEHLSFAEAVKRGVCPEPPAGVPSFEAIHAALAPLDPDLFAIVEQDLYPCAPDVPLPIAQRTRAYLRRCGFDG